MGERKRFKGYDELEVEVEVEVRYERYAESIIYSKEDKSNTLPLGMKTEKFFLLLYSFISFNSVWFVVLLFFLFLELRNGIDIDFKVRMYLFRLQLWLNSEIPLFFGFLNKIINFEFGSNFFICSILS